MDFETFTNIYATYLGSKPVRGDNEFARKKYKEFCLTKTASEVDGFFKELATIGIKRPSFGEVSSRWRKWQRERSHKPSETDEWLDAQEKKKAQADALAEYNKAKESTPYPGDCKAHGRKLEFTLNQGWFCWMCRTGKPGMPVNEHKAPVGEQTAVSPTVDTNESDCALELPESCFPEYDPNDDDGIPF